MRRLWTALLAVALLVGGGAAFALVSTQSPATAQEDVETDEAPIESDETTELDQTAPARPERGEILGGVLDELVQDGVITQAQADAITDAMGERLATVRQEFANRDGAFGSGPRGFGFRHLGFDLAGALEDGVIDADELAELGEDHPLNDPAGPAAPYLDDGQLTQEELQELRAELMPHGRRGGPPDTGDAPDAAEGLFSG